MSALTELTEEIRNCTRCVLHKSRNMAVPGEGAENADIMFIGEAPGWHEDRQGRPFVGAAGRLLDELLELIELKREDVYIANVLKCRPPGNRDPKKEEIEACESYLNRQLELIKPRMVVTLGRFSMARYLPAGAKISKVHGQPVKVGNIVCYPIFHPAAALHQPKWKDALVEDFRRIPEVLANFDKLDESAAPVAVEQISMF